MSPIDWKRPDYLLQGNERQRAAYLALRDLNLFEALAVYDPLLAGTIPLGIDLPESDLDVICYAPDLEVFMETVRRCFQQFPGFSLCRKLIRSSPVVVARFSFRGFPVEIFGQSVPSARQYAFRHMLVEHRLLESGGEGFRQKVMELKRQGSKTEPAFARLLGLEGDPYETILEVEGWGEEKVKSQIGKVRSQK